MDGWTVEGCVMGGVVCRGRAALSVMGMGMGTVMGLGVHAGIRSGAAYLLLPLRQQRFLLTLLALLPLRPSSALLLLRSRRGRSRRASRHLRGSRGRGGRRGCDGSRLFGIRHRWVWRGVRFGLRGRVAWAWRLE